MALPLHHYFDEANSKERKLTVITYSAVDLEEKGDFNKVISLFVSESQAIRSNHS